MSRFINGTSAQLRYTVPFTLDILEKNRAEDKLKMHILNTRLIKFSINNETNSIVTDFTV